MRLTHSSATPGASASGSLFGYRLHYKKNYTNQLAVVPRQHLHLIEQKIAILAADPTIDAKHKKRLQGQKGNLCRIRAGDYRVIYTFNNQAVTLLGVDHRSKVYRNLQLGRDEDDLDFVAGYVPTAEDAAFIESHRNHARSGRTWGTEELLGQADPHGDELLVQLLTPDLLNHLRIPATYHDDLCQCKTVGDLCRVAIPDGLRETIFDVATESNYDRICARPDFVLESFDDIRRLLEGDLVPMLLRLTDDQQKVVNWDLVGSGPALVKGGPGTGKTVIAAYRIKSILEKLGTGSEPPPRILYTTYTRALAQSAHDLIRNLLGDRANFVHVCTADSLVWELATQHARSWNEWSDDDRRQFWGHNLHDWQKDPAQGPLVAALIRLGRDFVFAEIDDVIMGREIASRADYLALERSGRRTGLGSEGREAIWAWFERERAETERLRQCPPAWLRTIIARKIRDGAVPDPYDAVVIDEAQDLPQTLIRIIVAHAPSADRIFLTADANQSIYGTSFSWNGLHEDLRMQGRTTILKRNHRTTREIAATGQGLLAQSTLDGESDPAEFSRRGPAPVFLIDPGPGKRASVLAEYIRITAAELRVGFGSCAVLVPTHGGGIALAAALTGLGLPAEHMRSEHLDLTTNTVKVLTMHTAKGLEFPVVALAGLDAWASIDPAENMELFNQDRADRNRRTLYVGMTRAMYALLVLIPPRLADDLATIANSPGLASEAPDWAAWLESIGALSNP